MDPSTPPSSDSRRRGRVGVDEVVNNGFQSPETLNKIDRFYLIGRPIQGI